MNWTVSLRQEKRGALWWWCTLVNYVKVMCMASSIGGLVLVNTADLRTDIVQICLDIQGRGMQPQASMFLRLYFCVRTDRQST